MAKRWHYKRRAFTSPGPDPWAVTNHELSVATAAFEPRVRVDVTLTDGPALVARGWLFLRVRGKLHTRTVFVSEAVNRWLYPAVRGLYGWLEGRHAKADMARDDDYYYA